MTESFVTECPHCQTSFRVSYHQLSAARGAVRCGSCLQVFNAARQLLEKSTGQSAAALFGDDPMGLKETAAVPGPQPLAVPELPLALETPLETPLESTPAMAPGTSTYQRVEPISQRRWAAAAEIDLDHLDLDDELARLERRTSPQTAEPAVTPGREDHLSASRDEPETANEEFDDPEEDEHRGPREQNSLPQGGDFEQKSSSPQGDDFDERIRETPMRPRRSAIEAADESLRRIDAPPLKPAAKARRAEPQLHDADLPDLSEDPLELQWQKPSSSWRKRLVWSLLVLLAALTLAGQYVAYHFDELARQDAYRPWFQQMCPALGCEVPSKVDIALIKSSNLVVRSHPQFSGALIVDAIIYNRAPFTQPFPLLELRFADLDGNLIASRRFKPSEYLSGDLAGQSDMPPQTPIHIALDILDPGSKAVNYSLSFQSPE